MQVLNPGFKFACDNLFYWRWKQDEIFYLVFFAPVQVVKEKNNTEQNTFQSVNAVCKAVNAAGSEFSTAKLKGRKNCLTLNLHIGGVGNFMYFCISNCPFHKAGMAFLRVE